MGMGACHTDARLAASVGELESPVTPDFKPALDVPNGGVLLALPALLSMGLLKTTPRFFELPKGYYGLESLFLLLAFMSLARLKFIESLRYCSPGEWGNLLGLDRVPEVKTLRNKIRLLSADNRPALWSEALCKEWMNGAPSKPVRCISMDTLARITGIKPNYRVIMSPDKNSAYAPPVTTRVTRWMGNPFLW